MSNVLTSVSVAIAMLALPTAALAQQCTALTSCDYTKPDGVPQLDSTGGTIAGLSHFEIDAAGNFNIPATMTCAYPGGGSGPTGVCMNFLAQTLSNGQGSAGQTINMVGTPGSGNGGYVGEIVNIKVADNNTGSAWDYNPSVDVPTTATGGGHIMEGDLGYHASTPTCPDAPGVPNCTQSFGLWMTGISFLAQSGVSNGVSDPASAGLFVTGAAPNDDNNGTDNNGVIWKQWRDGVRIAGPNATEDNDIFTQTDAGTGYTDDGNHGQAIGLNGNYTNFVLDYVPIINGSYTQKFWIKPDGSTWSASSVAAAGPVQPGSYTVARLPSPCTAGQFAYASDGRKPGEAAGAGSGVPVVCTASTQGGATLWEAISTRAVSN